MPRREDVLSPMKKEKKILAVVKNIIELASAQPLDVAEFALKSDLDEYYKMAKNLLKN